MEKKLSENTRSLLFAMLRREICGGASSDDTEITLNETEAEELYALSNRFELAHLVGDALKKSGTVLPETIAKKFKDRTERAIYRYCVMQNEIDCISALFEKEKIPFIPLKGAVLRNLYPEPWMRFSNDIDILVHPDDMKRADKALVSELQYEQFVSTAHDISYMSKTKMHLELHYNLIEDGWANDAKQILNAVWEYAFHEANSCKYTLDVPMFFFYHISHMTKHFEVGQCGIRPFLDLYILNQREEFQSEDCKKLTKKGNLSAFSELSCKLSEVWMEGEEHDESTQLLENFIFDISGSNNVAMLVGKHNNSRFQAILSKIFISYDVIKYQYPILRKHRWLTPIMEVRRWGKLIFCGGMKRSVDTIKNTANLSDKKILETKILLEKIGL